MKLYYSPGACSLAPHIVLREAGYPFDLEKVDLGSKKTASGENYAKVNPKGYVPALKLDDGQILTEAGVVLQYLADQKPESGLAPKLGTLERYRLMEWLNFISTEIHKQFAPLFKPNITPEWRENQINALAQRFEFLSEKLDGSDYLTGDRFTIADAYLFTVLSWSKLLKVDLGKWQKLGDYVARVGSRPAVKEAMKAEGLSQ